MEVSSRRRGDGSNISPERKMVWIETKAKAKERKVPVVYYLSRNGHFEHPHFMEVSIPLGGGLYLKDVIKRLNSLRGQGMAGMYSWSSKRSFKNGFVWHDLCNDDFIYPAHGNEYILKGSEILHPENPSSSQDEPLQNHKLIQNDSNIGKIRRPWSSFDLNEYKVYKNKVAMEMKNMDACTQTEDTNKQSRRHSHVIKEQEEEEEENPITELSRDDISPPSSTSSSEMMEALVKADGSIVPIENPNENVGGASRRKLMKSPSALMQLLACGSISVKERGLSLASHLKERMSRTMTSEEVKMSDSEDKEFFSGSLIELKKKQSVFENGEFSGLKRSSSCNAERGLKIDLSEKEIEGVGARCVPRRPKTTVTKKEVDPTISSKIDEVKSSLGISVKN